MSYLVDTNVLSELTRPRPDEGVQEWFATTPESDIHISTITIAELRRGVTRLPTGKRREALANWLDVDIVARFNERIIDVTVDIGNLWSELVAATERRGVSLHPLDAFIVATSMMRSHRLVTRNTRDFGNLNIELVNPWTG